MASGWFWDDLRGWFRMVMRWCWKVLRVSLDGFGMFWDGFWLVWGWFWDVVVHGFEVFLACFLIVFGVPGARWLRRLRSQSPMRATERSTGGAVWVGLGVFLWLACWIAFVGLV